MINQILVKRSEVEFREVLAIDTVLPPADTAHEVSRRYLNHRESELRSMPTYGGRKKIEVKHVR